MCVARFKTQSVPSQHNGGSFPTRVCVCVMCTRLMHTCLSRVNAEQPNVIALVDLARRRLYRYHTQPDSAGPSEQIWWTR